jgi:hypothetical protein
MLTVPTKWPTTLTLMKSFWLECGPNQVLQLEPANLNWCVREGVMSFSAVSVLLAWSVKASDCGPWSHANWSPSAKHAHLQCLWHPKSRAGPSTSPWRRQMPRASVITMSSQRQKPHSGWFWIGQVASPMAKGWVHAVSVRKCCHENGWATVTIEMPK